MNTTTTRTRPHRMNTALGALLADRADEIMRQQAAATIEGNKEFPRVSTAHPYHADRPAITCIEQIRDYLPEDSTDAPEYIVWACLSCAAFDLRLAAAMVDNGYPADELTLNAVATLEYLVNVDYGETSPRLTRAIEAMDEAAYMLEDTTI